MVKKVLAQPAGKRYSPALRETGYPPPPLPDPISRVGIVRHFIHGVFFFFFFFLIKNKTKNKTRPGVERKALQGTFQIKLK